MSNFLNGAATGAVDAFVKAALAGKTLADAQAAAKSALGNAVTTAIDSRWAMLAEPLLNVARAEIKNHQNSSIDLLDASRAQQANALGLTWSLQGQAGIGLEIDVMDPELDEDRRKELGISAEEARTVVSYALRGALGASAAGNRVTPVWQLGASASASVGGRMEWYVAAPSSARLGEAFIAALPLMPAPMDLRAMVIAARNPDFWGCSTDIEGLLQVGFSAKASLSGAGASLSIDGKSASLGLSLGIAGQASFALGGAFKLHCTPVNRNGEFQLHVQLEQTNTREQSLGLEVSLGADFSAITKAAESYLRSRTLEPNTRLLDLLTEPASAISDKIEAALGKLLGDTALKDLVPLLSGSGDDKAAAAKLAKALSGPVADRLDLLSGELEGNQPALDAFAQELAVRLFGSTPVPDAAMEKVEDFVKDAASQVLAKLTAGIDELVGDLDKKAGSAAEKIIAPLAALGEKVAEAIGDVSNAITKSQALAAIKTGLERYAKLRKQVLSVLGDAQRVKVTLALGVAVQEMRGRQLVFEGDFRLVDDMLPAERLFAALWRGDLREFSVLREEAQASGSLNNVSGWLELTAKRTVKESVTLSAFGFDFTQAKVRTVDLVLRSDLSGNLIAANGKAGATSTTINPWVQREVSLGLAVRLAAAQTPAARGEIEFAGSFSAGGKRLDKRLFDDLQRSVALLTGQPDPVDLARLVNGPKKFDEGFWRSVTFVLPMALTDGEISRLVNTDIATGRLTLLQRALDAMDRSLTNTNVFPFAPGPSILLAQCARDVVGSTRDVDKLDYLARFPRSANWVDLAVQSEQLGFGVVSSSGSSLPTSTAARQLVAFYRLSRAVRAFGDLLSACKGLKAELATASSMSSEVVFERCFHHLKSASDALSVFAISSETLIGNREPVSWPLVAFAAALSELARGEEGPRFLPLVILTEHPDRPVPLID